MNGALGASKYAWGAPPQKGMQECISETCQTNLAALYVNHLLAKCPINQQILPIFKSYFAAQLHKHQATANGYFILKI